MKILIVSDTHGREQYLFDTLQKVKPIDLLIHLGDFEGGDELIQSFADCSVEFVSGNNDFFTGIPKEKIIHIGKYKVLLTHGHRYSVNYCTEVIRDEARRNGVDIVMFGHTHVPYMDLNSDVWLINPGSISLPRQQGRIPTFIIMDIDSKGDAHFTLNYVNK
ncbi:MAG: metallophosphoesterase [Clostridiales bacterium]|jgi:putative phosphoesterase|nr:metallophosphoesterase [Clostridiales bacterium]